VRNDSLGGKVKTTLREYLDLIRGELVVREERGRWRCEIKGAKISENTGDEKKTVRFVALFGEGDTKEGAIEDMQDKMRSKTLFFSARNEKWGCPYWWG